MNRQLPLFFLAAIMCSSATATESAQPSEKAIANPESSISIATESLELNSEIEQLAQRRLQQNDEALAEEIAATTAIKLQRFAASDD